MVYTDIPEPGVLILFNQTGSVDFSTIHELDNMREGFLEYGDGDAVVLDADIGSSMVIHELGDYRKYTICDGSSVIQAVLGSTDEIVEIVSAVIDSFTVH